ncbi:hypothetical protein HPB47_001567 [Ixodes persulcatus]|uniref:Uncharacterized protein n=1 Tax=Ixodes persulcatus TaxID=34615 RepID=A0AC60PNN3_IXOPE|nr:hypothetical protein HPB47_001567 [Ixodes persulcatus]
MYQEGLTLLTDPTTPTRTGTSSCRDTCPDLTFVKNVKDAKWENTNENLGSNHFILETTAACTSVKPRKLGQVKIIEWDKWREHRGVSTSAIWDIESWTREAVSSTAAYTKVLTVDEETPCSELLVFKNPYSRQPPADLNIYIDGQEVPKPKEVRILGQILTQSGRNLSTINELTTSTTHVVGMLRRIRNQRPKSTSVIIRRAFKCALGLPEYVATEDLLSTGLYNTIEELWEAQRISQIKTLSEIQGNTATLAVADPRGNVVRTASVYTTLTEHAEEAAIALAATGTKQDHITVITDSQRACRNFAKGEKGEQAARILSKAQFTSMKIVWATGHAGVEGNEAANAAARAFHSNRDSSAPQPHSPDPNMKYNEYLKTIRGARMTLPAPPSKFTKEEEHLYRRLQTGTMKTPMKLHQWYPQLHPSPTCSFCGWKWGDLYHLMWVCKHIKGLDPIPNPTRDSWNAALRWSDPGSQHWLLTLLGYKVDRKLGDLKARFCQNSRQANTGANPQSPLPAPPPSPKRGVLEFLLRRNDGAGLPGLAHGELRSGPPVRFRDGPVETVKDKAEGRDRRSAGKSPAGAGQSVLSVAGTGQERRSRAAWPGPSRTPERSKSDVWRRTGGNGEPWPSGLGHDDPGVVPQRNSGCDSPGQLAYAALAWKGRSAVLDTGSDCEL